MDLKNILVIGICIVFPSLGSEAVQECSWEGNVSIATEKFNDVITEFNALPQYGGDLFLKDEQVASKRGISPMVRCKNLDWRIWVQVLAGNKLMIFMAYSGLSQCFSWKWNQGNQMKLEGEEVYGPVYNKFTSHSEVILGNNLTCSMES